MKITLACAKEVIHLSKDPQQRPQKAIEAAEQYLLDPSEVNRKTCKDAAAYAAYAADARAKMKKSLCQIIRGIVPILEII